LKLREAAVQVAAGDRIIEPMIALAGCATHDRIESRPHKGYQTWHRNALPNGTPSCCAAAISQYFALP